MHVAVGSRNPVKVAAVEAALPEAEVEAVGVESGVAEQPFGLAETVTGAENRARRALPGYALAVGIEGGVARLDAVEGLWLVMWAAATDGDRWGRGGGPSLRLPDGIATRIEAGEELGPVMDDVLGTEDVAKKQGAAGALTGTLTDRETALREAVAGALGPFVTDHYD
ncbi:inosine/xanthosine triphosphatase [Halorarius litoreus]|uniref:inosine/xanthosine triphosphatase n=1 Tax=Halorarius litoreus TaxID=2962676 RepID=UPI0020CFB899|nr:inosine/xanthosine triphosphatase [Halorarius litoreus]